MRTHPRVPSSYEQERRDVLAEVRAIYREVDQRPILRNCTRLTECCQFQLTGRSPQLTRGEALVAVQALKASGRKEVPESFAGKCPLLKADGKCLIYADRPFGCRTHFCAAAGGPFARAQVIDLIRRLEELDRKLGGDGPKSLSGALGLAI